ESRRQDPSFQASRTARHAVPARQYRQAGQDHPARPLHHGPAGQGRVLQGRRSDVHGLCRGGERGGARSRHGRSRRHPARPVLARTGPDVTRLDEPWLRNNPEEAKLYAVKVINRALAGLTVPTVVHLCFGYAAVVRGGKPTGYAFLPQLADSIAQQISIESAQPRIDLGVLKELAPK